MCKHQKWNLNPFFRPNYFPLNYAPVLVARLPKGLRGVVGERGHHGLPARDLDVDAGRYVLRPLHGALVAEADHVGHVEHAHVAGAAGRDGGGVVDGGVEIVVRPVVFNRNWSISISTNNDIWLSGSTADKIGLNAKYILAVLASFTKAKVKQICYFSLF